MTVRKTYSVNTYLQFEELIKNKRNKKKCIVIFIKNYLVKGFGVEWLSEFIRVIKNNYSDYNIKFYVDAGYDHGLSLLMLNKNIDYIKLKSNSIILKKISSIAKKNKVSLNPDFDIVDFPQKKYNN